jgi:hypothetical protein
MFLCNESISISVSGVLKFRVSGDPTATGNIFWNESNFVTTDTFSVTMTSAVHAERVQRLFGCIDLDYEPMPEVIHWLAYLVESRANAMGIVVWAASGTAKSPNGSSAFEFGITGPFLGHASASREEGPLLSLSINWSHDGPVEVPSLGSAKGQTPITLYQTPRDALRQEYINFGSLWVPSDSDIVSLFKPFNTGNYIAEGGQLPVEAGGGTVANWGIGINSGFEAKLNAVTTAYRGRPVMVGPDKPDSLHLLNGLVGEPLERQTC